MKIKERLKIPQAVLIEICKELGYEEFRNDKINFVRDTPVGRIHITLIKDRSNSINLEIHHDVLGDKPNDHYTKLSDCTPRKAWDEIQSKVYERKMQKKEETPCQM
jgi:hypothetical protein